MKVGREHIAEFAGNQTNPALNREALTCGPVPRPRVRCPALGEFRPVGRGFLQQTSRRRPRRSLDPSADARCDRGTDQSHFVLVRLQGRGRREQPAGAHIVRKNKATMSPRLADRYMLTVLPFSMRARSQTAISAAYVLNSRTWVSRSADHLLTISSMVLPRSMDGAGTDTATEGAPRAETLSAEELDVDVGCAAALSTVVPGAEVPKVEPSGGASAFSVSEGMLIRAVGRTGERLWFVAFLGR
jgi:hypothetical protein